MTTSVSEFMGFILVFALVCWAFSKAKNFTTRAIIFVVLALLIIYVAVPMLRG